MRRKNRYNRHLYNAYDLDLKKSVVIFAEENGNKEAQAHYGISEANIRRWRRLKNDIFGKPHDYSRGNLRTRKRVNYNCKLEKVSCDSGEQDSQSSVGESTSHSMPLQERLSKVAAQEKIAAAGTAGPLKSQPLSPTKLKVTRQGPKITKQIEPPPSPVNEEMCLRWNSHHSNMQTAFPSILSKEQYVDVTLAAEGKTLKCHRLILSSCSPYFEEILSNISPFQHPVLFMRDIPFWILKSLCDFMYAGEVHIFQNKLEELLSVAEALKIKGLAGKSTPPPSDQTHNSNNNNNNNNHKEKKNKHQEKTHLNPPVKKNPIFTQSHYESTSQDYDDDLLDPLDLLEPLYEEAAEEKKPTSTVVRPPRENKYQYQPVKKPFNRRLRKRKYSEQREPSPPPVFSFRKGTRSRPNVKIPKYYHSDYSNPPKPALNPQTDPLLEVDEIKTEPIDVEDNLIDYSDEDHYVDNSSVVVEQATCDNSIISNTLAPSILEQDKFKKIKLSKPIITEVHTIEEPNTTTSGGLEVIKITVQQTDEIQSKKDEEEEEEEEEVEEKSGDDPLDAINDNNLKTLQAPVEDPPPIVENEVAEVTEDLPEANVVELPSSKVDCEIPVEGVIVDQETGGCDEINENVSEIRIENVRSNVEEIEQNDVRNESLDHLEKEAMNCANAINMENQTQQADIE